MLSYNSQVSDYVVGDLVLFTGYELDNPPLAHKIGIVMSANGSVYEVLWLNSGTRISVSAKHLELAYIKNKTDL